jgi:hypothetical protein
LSLQGLSCLKNLPKSEAEIDELLEQEIAIDKKKKKKSSKKKKVEIIEEK